MATTTVNSGSTLKKYERNHFKEYVRESGFKPYIGPGTSKPFVTKQQLISGGQIINIPLVTALKGQGTGSGTLVGNEEALGNYSYDVKPVWHRHAVEIRKNEEHKSAIDLYMAAKDMLKYWCVDEMRDGIIYALDAMAEDSSAYNESTGKPKQVNYADATATQRNTWATNNANRVLFGDAVANYSATMSTALASITTSMTLGLEEISLMKRIAKARDRETGRSAVRPIRVENGNGREYYIMFVDSTAFRDIKAAMTTANLDGRPRDPGSNPYFQDGDLIYDGVIIKEIPEITATGAVGDSSARVVPAYFCGAQALGIAYGQELKITQRKEDDYGFVKGVGVEELWSAEKLFYNNQQHGLVTGFFYAAA